MAARSNGSVTLSIGMLHIPLKLYISASAENVKFNLINKETKNRIKLKQVDAKTGDEVEETLKGFEYVKNNYVLFTEEEVAGMQAHKKDTAEIKEFVPIDNLDPILIEKSIYLLPDKGSDKSYLLLTRILEEEKKAAVAVWYARGKEHLVLVRPYKDGLIMHQMFYSSEVRPFENTCAQFNITDQEMDLAKQLVDQFSSPFFDNSKYVDGFVKRVRDAVDEKIRSGSCSISSTGLPHTDVTDLFDALKQSILANNKGTSKKKVAKKTAKKTSRKRKVG